MAKHLTDQQTLNAWEARAVRAARQVEQAITARQLAPSDRTAQTVAVAEWELDRCNQHVKTLYAQVARQGLQLRFDTRDPNAPRQLAFC